MKCRVSQQLSENHRDCDFTTMQVEITTSLLVALSNLLAKDAPGLKCVGAAAERTNAPWATAAIYSTYNEHVGAGNSDPPSFIRANVRTPTELQAGAALTSAADHEQEPKASDWSSFLFLYSSLFHLGGAPRDSLDPHSVFTFTHSSSPTPIYTH